MDGGVLRFGVPCPLCSSEAGANRGEIDGSVRGNFKPTPTPNAERSTASPVLQLLPENLKRRRGRGGLGNDANQVARFCLRAPPLPTVNPPLTGGAASADIRDRRPEDVHVRRTANSSKTKR